MREKGCLHFVGFKDSTRFWNAVRVFGYPDFIHRNWDSRAAYGGEWDSNDTRVFADGDDSMPPKPQSRDDSAFF